MILELTYAQTPHALFTPLLRKPQPVLLHSADKSNRFGRYDVLSADPVQRVQWTKGYLTVGEHRVATADPLHRLGEQHDSFCQQLKTNAHPAALTPPFSAGFIGYFGYPLHQNLEQHQPPPTDPTGLPELQGGFYDWSIVTDHWQQTTCLITVTKARQQQILAWLDEPKIEAIANQIPRLRPTSTKADYQAAFDQVQDYLGAGDCYQVNLAQHFCAEFTGDPWQLYQHWCEQQAAPFNAYLDFSSPGEPPTALLSLSPERFLEIENRRATVCPIKGTAARGVNAKQDDELEAQLRASNKDIAENLMIVDLLRNDLGRICEVGSVEVTHLFELLKFSNVQHLVSTITGNLSQATSVMQTFKALFPSGSITGAPKIRAIDIINELEPVGRSVYSGSIGYWDRSGRFDSNVAIRTGLVTNGQAHLWGGGGIVADSSCSAELREIQQKVGRLLAT